MTDSRHRRSRIGWPDPEPPPVERRQPLGQHTHRQPRVPWIIVFAALALLTAAVALLVYYQLQFNDYVHDRGQLRDEQNRQLQQQIQQGMCDLLDQLPQSPVLDGPRRKYHCGPGLPVVPPATAKVSPVPSHASVSTPPPEPLEGAVVPGPRPSGVPVPTRPKAPATTTTAPPLPPSPTPTPTAPTTPAVRSPLPDPVCALLRVCLLEERP